MELHNKKKRKGPNNISLPGRNMLEAVDRITTLHDPILHHILSFLEIKDVARTSVLSKRWKEIWKSVPTLDFLSLYHGKAEDPMGRTHEDWFVSNKETKKFMAIVDRVLHLHDTSSTLQKFSIRWKKNWLDKSRVDLWISGAVMRKVKELSLTICLKKSLCPISLFTCESLIRLELNVFTRGRDRTFYIPNRTSLPNLKHLKLSGIKFSNEYENEIISLSSCPVLEDLTMVYCEWVHVSNFCISAPSIEYLKIINDSYGLDYLDYDARRDLRDCSLKIDAPRLVSLTYKGSIAKDYALSSPLTLVEANVSDIFPSDDIIPGSNTLKSIGAAVIRFLQVLLQVKVLSIADHKILEALSSADNLIKVLPTFNNLEKLNVSAAENEWEALIALFRAAPNLESLVFDEVKNRFIEEEDDDEDDNWVFDSMSDDEDDDLELDRMRSLATGCFLHLKSVCFKRFTGDPWEMRWVKLILEKAEVLQTMTISVIKKKRSKEDVLARLSSVFSASATSCVLNFS